MKYIIQIHLEYKEDIIREIKIPISKSLEDLHYTIIESFNLDNNEMASFYRTNEKLEILQEIPIFQIDENEDLTKNMSEISIKEIFNKANTQLIYIYDFLKMWRFLVSFIDISKDDSQDIKLIKSTGEMPKNAPKIVFQSDKIPEEKSEDTYGMDNNEDFYDPSY